MELLDKLLSLGEPSFDKQVLGQQNYVETLGLSQDDGEGLVAIAIDEFLFDDDETWSARVHAWRALAQLQYQPALKPLLPLFIENSDWIWEELPHVYAAFGLKAAPVLLEAIQDLTAHNEIRSLAAASLEMIGQQSDEARATAIEALSAGLSTYKRNDRDLNGSIVVALAELKAVEAYDLLEAAHDADRVNTFHYGSWASVQVGLGVKQKSDFTPEELSPLYKDRVNFSQAQDEFKRLRYEPDRFFTAAQTPRKKQVGFAAPKSDSIKKGKQKKVKKKKKR